MRDRRLTYGGGVVEMNSGVSAGEVTSAVLAVDELQSFGGGLHWLESAGSKTSIASWSPGGTVESHEFDAGSAVHSYGGGTFAHTASGLLAVSKADGQIWKVDPAERLTDLRGHIGGLVAAGERIIAVLDSGDRDALIEVDLTTHQTETLHQAPFIASPTVNEHRIAWAQWPEQAAPWNHSEIWIAEHRPGRPIAGPERIAGGSQESAIEPKWGPDEHLYFLSDRTGWWNLYRWNGSDVEPLAPIEADCAAAPWELGYSSYAFLESGRIAMLARSGPPARLLIAEPGGPIREIPTPYTSIKPYLTALGDRVSLIGSSASMPPQAALIEPDEPHDMTVIRASTSQTPSADHSDAEILTTESDSGRITFVWHPPQGHDGAPAPTIVRAHPGPTHHVEIRLDADLWFYTSQGFAVVDVDYRGSTGYGRAFRQSLYGHWGDYDAADCADVARSLVETGRSRPGAVFILGASAGGFTALNAACLPDNPFTLAVARSAIVDPLKWAEATPRFHRPNARALAGARVDAARVNIPVLLIHGDDDKVVPVDDVAELAKALSGRRKLVGLVRFPDGGHYLSGTQVKAKVLENEVDAFRRALSSDGPSPE